MKKAFADCRVTLTTSGPNPGITTIYNVLGSFVGDFSFTNTGYRLAQTFLATKDADTVQASISFRTAVGDDSVFRCGIFATTAGAPSGTAIDYSANVTLSDHRTASSSFIPFEITGLSLTQGTQYALVFELITPDDITIPRIHYNTTAPYPNGAVYDDANIGSFTLRSTRDIIGTISIGNA